MKRHHSMSLCTLLLTALLIVESAGMTRAEAAQPPPDIGPRLQEIFALRTQWLLTESNPRSLESDYVPGLKTAQWALHHEHGKIKYVRVWAGNRGVRVVEAVPQIRFRYLGGDADRARVYVAESLQLGYVYPGEAVVNRFGVGTRHVLTLRRQDDRWLIGAEWYLDPLGDDSEVPDVTPAMTSGVLPAPAPFSSETAAWQPRRYQRAGAIAYADRYCGLAWGCGNDHGYNRRFRDYTGDGGDCTNFISQALRVGGKLPTSIHIRVSALAHWLQGSGWGRVVVRGPFQALWKQAATTPDGFRSLIRTGDVITYVEKGKLSHFAMVTAFDSHGYPLVNSHTTDRYHVPFDLGWDRKTIYWFFRIRD